jgi:hypothetical protein
MVRSSNAKMGMKKLILAFLLALTTPAWGQQSVVVPATTASIAITGTVAGATVLVTGVAGKSIYVTGVLLVSNTGTSTVTFTQGTGAACGTGTTNVTGALSIANGQTVDFGVGYGAVWALLQGNSLCITIATNPSPGSIAYSLF